MEPHEPASIEDLRNRWRSERSPHLGLKLAEELRRAGRTDEAITALEKTLELHPGHLASRVALGRSRLDSGQADRARVLLEQVIAQDPANLVANKALLRSYVELGDRERAAERLELCRLLNESDPELDDLEARLQGAGEAAEPGPPSPAAVPARPAPPAAADAEPFADLLPAPAVESYWSALAAEGIFQLAPPASVPGPPPDAGEAAAAAAAVPVAEVEAPAAAPPSDAPAPPATTTLGRLYLDQGHAGEAEGIFRRVLASRPGEREAVRGLAEAQRRRGWRLTAADLVDDGAAGPERQRQLLRGYLERLRSGAGGS